MRFRDESGQGTTGVKASYFAAKPSSTFNIKWDGVSLLNNFEYNETGVRVWRAFNVGSGKVVPWAKFEEVWKQPEKLEIPDSPSQNPRGAPTFKIMRHRHIKKSYVKADFSTENENQDRSQMTYFSHVQKKDVLNIQSFCKPPDTPRYWKTPNNARAGNSL